MQSKAPTSDPTNFFGPILYHGIFPLMLITLCPITVVSIVHANKELDGSITALFDLYFQKGFTDAFGEIWKTPDFETWKILSIFVAFEAFLLLMVPGKIHRGPLTQTAHTPVYTANGFQCFSITMVVFLAMQYYGLYDFAIIYDKFPQIIAACCVFSLIFCAFLVFKGVYFPSSTDNLVSGNPIMDYFWGIEVYPRFGKLDLKTLVNCRVGMMGWALLLLCYLFKQSQLQHGEVSNSMYISVGVQLIYIAKFFWWETGYFDSIDIMHDRFGFYICWGCLTWLPSLYTNCTFYLVNHPVNLPTPLAVLVFLAGVAAVAINYAIDEERQRFRKTGGNTIIWGKKPEYVVAKYVTEDGKEKKSLLLVSGWWGISRHFNYVAELAAALLWTPPVQFNHFLPYFYFFYLVILLVHRSFRDESRCTKKYGKAYDEYKKRVPYKMIPGLL